MSLFMNFLLKPIEEDIESKSSDHSIANTLLPNLFLHISMQVIRPSTFEDRRLIYTWIELLGQARVEASGVDRPAQNK